MYPGLKLDAVRSDVAAVIHPFFEEILMGYGGRVDSLYVVGSALTLDYDPKRSDVNSVVCLKKMNLEVLDFVAQLGSRFGKKRVRAPLVMTPWYVEKSRDVFPIELLDLRSLHSTVYGDDRFAPIEVALRDLRLECERELKSILVRLRQGYLAAAGEPEAIRDLLVPSLSTFVPLFRALLVLHGSTEPVGALASTVAKEEVIRRVGEAMKLDVAPVRDVLALRSADDTPTRDYLVGTFRALYSLVDAMADKVDQIPVPDAAKKV